MYTIIIGFQFLYLHNLSLIYKFNLFFKKGQMILNPFKNDTFTSDQDIIVIIIKVNYNHFDFK